MRMPATLTIVDEKPIIELEDGTIIDHKSIGYIAHGWGVHPRDLIYESATIADIDFIVKNNIQIEVEMTDEFSNPEQYSDVGLFEGVRKPKLIKNKIIIHLK
jgi:hypothetical protein